MDEGKQRFHCQVLMSFKKGTNKLKPSFFPLNFSLSLFTRLKQARKSQTQTGFYIIFK